MITAVIFDLDGTLLDTLADLTGSINHMLAALGRPARSQAEVSSFLGDSVLDLVTRALPPGCPDGEIDAGVELFHQHYAANLSVQTRPFPGIPALLTELRARGIAVGVVSNQAHGPVEQLVAAHFPGLVGAAVGHQDGIEKKPNPAGVRHVLTRLGADPAGAVFVGDTEVDMRTARNAGLTAAGALWGGRSAERLRSAGADFVLRSPADLLALLI